jgi:hypothetical protein
MCKASSSCLLEVEVEVEEATTPLVLVVEAAVNSCL